MTEIRRPDGTLEVICRQCHSTSRCEVCGLVSEDRRAFGVRKVEGRWRVVCKKCIMGETEGGRPGAPGAPRGRPPRRR